MKILADENIYVKLYKVTVEEAFKLFKNYFAALNKDDITDNLIIVTQEGTRIRRSRR